MAGEEVWLSLWLYDRGTGQLSDNSSIAYVEIIDPFNRPVAQVKALLEKGKGATIIELPDTLANGSFTLRAYTNRMKSYLPEGCFMKTVTVINPFSDRFLNFRETAKTGEGQPFRIAFYPEGGKMIAGLPCKVGITVLNKNGEPERCSGVIKSEAGDTLAVADIDSSGIGSVWLTPAAGRALFFEAENRAGVFALPAVTGAGSAISVVRHDNDSLVISLLSNNYQGTWLNLVIQSRGKLSHATRIRVTGRETLISIRGDVLVPGINDIALFDTTGSLLSERLLFRPPDGDTGLRIDCSPVYGRREKVSLEIVRERPSDPQYDLTELSLSVSLHPGSEYLPGADELLVKGTEYVIPESGSLLPEVFYSLFPDKKDILLLGTKSLWINWNNILTGRWKKPVYPYEKGGQYICVSFFDQKGVPAEEGSVAYLSIPGKTPEFQYAVADSTGRFCFFTEHGSQVKDLVFQPADTAGSYSAKIEDQFSEKYLSSDFVIDTARVLIPEEIAALAANFQIQKIYENGARGDSIIPPLKTTVQPRFYGKPDQELVMDDYVALTTMKEVFFELVRRVSVRTNRKENSYMIYDPVLKRNPALFIDGVPIDDAAKIINMNPSHVEQIDVLPGDYRIGDIIFPGIINVTSANGTYTDIPLPENAVRIRLKMFEGQWVFISPEYPTEEKKKQRIPDFRNTLHWTPAIRRDETGKMRAEFWTSDHSAEYMIDLEGVSSSGKVVSVRKAVRVQ